MKLGEAIPKYQAYRNQLHDNQNQIYKKLKEAKEKAEHSDSEEWSQKVDQLQFSYDEAKSNFDKYESVLDGLKEQWCNASNAENARALADPETGLGATIGKIMTTVARIVIVKIHKHHWEFLIVRFSLAYMALYAVSFNDLLTRIALLSLRNLLISPMIIGTAYVENFTSRLGLKLSIALISPIQPI